MPAFVVLEDESELQALPRKSALAHRRTHDTGRNKDEVIPNLR